MVADWVSLDVDWNSKLYGWLGEYLAPIEELREGGVFCWIQSTNLVAISTQQQYCCCLQESEFFVNYRQQSCVVSLSEQILVSV